VVIRPVDPAADFPGIAALHSAYNPDFVEPLTVERLLENERLPGRIRRQFVAIEPGGAMAGCAQALHGPWLPEGTFDITVLVDPAHRKRGVGGGLYRAALECVADLGATRIQTAVADDDPAALEFAERHGFAVGCHRFKSSLEVGAFVPVAGVLARVTALGVGVVRFDPAVDDRVRLYELHRRGELDEPSSTGVATPYEEYSRATFDRPNVVVFLAVTAAGEWLGLAQLEIQAGRAYHELSCVERAWRGLGIAQALKLHTIEYARSEGLLRMTTGNDSRNAAMLAINRKFGYQHERGRFEMFLATRRNISPDY
jgi:GNAT superfamily N-acetyltransferase